MTRLQAAMKDISARKWKERKLIKRIGHPRVIVYDKHGEISLFIPRCACMQCDSLQIFEYFEPIAAGRRFWCWDCGAIDELARGENWKNSGQKKPQSTKQTVGRKRQPRMNITAFKLIERF